MSRTHQGLLGLLSLTLVAAGTVAATSTSAGAAPYNGPLVQIVAGTVPLGNLRAGSEGSSPTQWTTVAGGYLGFLAFGDGGQELYTSDGTPAGTAVAVAAPGGVTPTGAVTLSEKGKTISTGSLSGGSATVRITTKLKPGKHKLTASYAGHDRALASASSVVKFTVQGKKPTKR